MRRVKEHLKKAQALRSAIVQGEQPTDVRQAWHLKKRITEAQKQLDQVKQRITQEMRVMHEEKQPEVAAVGAGSAGHADGDHQNKLAAYRAARSEINDILLETWEVKFDLDEYIRSHAHENQPGSD